MSTRNRSSSSNMTTMDFSLALTESYDAEIAPLLTTIDRMRNQISDIDATIDVPAIVVIGEQSAGKSSVLEALSSIPLPRGGQHMTTKCPLELRMRRSTTFHASLECPGHRRSESIENIQDIGTSIIREQNSLTSHRDKISKQKLLLNIQAPWLPNLTLIDLPGIIQVASSQQDKALVTDIKELVEEYLTKPSTIILAIIQACNDIETSAAIKYAKMFDPDGERTVGVLTKLDLVDRGVEQKILEVFENKRIPLKLGYLMVKCRTQEDISNNITLSEALEKEQDFFQRSPKFQTVSADRRGCPALARFLTRELVRNIKQALPHLIADLRNKINNVDEQYRQLGVDDHHRLILTSEARSRYLTEKFFTAMQLFRTEIHHVKEGAQVHNPLYDKRNELNHQFYNDMHNHKLDDSQLIPSIESAMIFTQGPEPSDYILFRVTKAVCRSYIRAIRPAMEKYLSNMLERVNSVISNVINKVFHSRPNLLSQMGNMHGTIEQQIKAECYRELELILEMEESFVYADNPLYRETLQQMKAIHSSIENEVLGSTSTRTHSKVNLSTNSTSASLKRAGDEMSEDDDDITGKGSSRLVKIPRSSNVSSNRSSSIWSNWFSTRQNIFESSTLDNNETRLILNQASTTKPSMSTAHKSPISEEIIQYRIRILATQDIICKRIILTYPQRIEYQLVRKQFAQLDLQSSIFSSECLERVDHLMAYDTETERRQNDLMNRRKIYDETIRELQNLK